MTVDSLLTRAMNSGTVESLTGADIASRLGTPFGGSPTSAVALPIVMQGTTLAVVYADDADMPEYARGRRCTSRASGSRNCSSARRRCC